MGTKRQHLVSGAFGFVAAIPLLFAIVLALGATPALAQEDSLGDAILIESVSDVIELGEGTSEADVQANQNVSDVDVWAPNEVQVQDGDPETPEPQDLSTATIDARPQTFSGNALEPELVVTLGESTLLKDVDFTVEFSNNVHVGKASISITGTGNYTGSASGYFSIVPKEVKPSIVLSTSSYVYDGTVKTPAVTVKDGQTVLKKDQDYKVLYASGRKDQGTYAVTVSLCGDYTGENSVSYRITPRSLADAMIAKIENKTYTGKKQTPKPRVTIGSTKLKLNRDYTLSYSKNLNAGTAKVVVKGTGNYKGSCSNSFKIVARSIAKSKVSNIKSKTYAGKKITQKPRVTLGSTKLKLKRDYTIAYSKNLNAGTAKVIIKGKGNYKGKVTKTFKIAKRNFAKAKVAKVGSQLYTGRAITPKPTVKWGSKKLKRNRDYTLSYSNNTALGTATIVVTGKGNYTATRKTVSFVIYQPDASSFKVGSISTQDWTGSDIKPNPTVKCQGRTLKKGRDYTVSYANNRYGGTASMTITGKGSYKGSKTVTFAIDGPKYVGQTVYITNTGEKYHNAGCRYLYSSHAVDLGEAEWLGYEPCKVCH